MTVGSSLLGSPQAAIDPIGLLVFIIIIINVVATFFKRARAQQSKQSDAASSMRTEEAMRKSSSDLAATRAAQRARLQQAIDAARQQRRTPSPVAPPVAMRVSPSPSKPLPPPPMVAPSLDALPSFQFEAQLAPDLTLLPGPQKASLAPPPTLPILGGKFSGSDLFIAAAVIGPCAALRTPGHTPAGW